MARDDTSGTEKRAPVALTIGALALLVLGGFLAGRFVVSLVERGELSLDSSVALFFLGVACLVIGLFLVWNRY